MYESPGAGFNEGALILCICVLNKIMSIVNYEVNGNGFYSLSMDRNHVANNIVCRFIHLPLGPC